MTTQTSMMTMMNTTTTNGNFVIPEWPAPSNVHAISTTRHNGFSTKPFDSLNLGKHVGDNSEHVEKNRALIQQVFSLKNTPLWLNQVHGPNVINADNYIKDIDADAAICQVKQIPLAIMTADCLPILLCDKQGTQIAAIHGGWKSLQQGIIENTCLQLKFKPENLLAWLGPCISQKYFEIGDEVRSAFCQKNTIHENAFAFNPASKKYHGCLKTIARNELNTLGIIDCFQSDLCTYENTLDFFSYRRERITGRMATFIWMDAPL